MRRRRAACAKHCEGEGTVRTLAAGSTFTLIQAGTSPGDHERQAVMAVRHQARNNFSEQMGKVVREALPPAGMDADLRFLSKPLYRL